MTQEVKLLTEAEALELYLNLPRADYLAALRERGLIAEEPEPVDPLLVEAVKIIEDHNYCEGDLAQDVAIAALRRGMELQREKLTREMVERAVRRNVTLVSGGGGCLCEVTIDCATIHAALTEALQ